jgi:hypothetical protein
LPFVFIGDLVPDANALPEKSHEFVASTSAFVKAQPIRRAFRSSREPDAGIDSQQPGR